MVGEYRECEAKVYIGTEYNLRGELLPHDKEENDLYMYNYYTDGKSTADSVQLKQAIIFCVNLES